MKESKNYKLQPAVFGVFICVFLIISRYLGNSGSSSRMLSLNTVLIIVLLCLCLHLVRRTSELFQDHVWISPWAVVLLAMPLINLVITGVQLIIDASAVFSSGAFSAALIFLSMPVFMCLYFLYLTYKVPDNRPLRAISVVLSVIGIVYIVFRLLSAVIFPAAVSSGRNINDTLEVICSNYADISLAIYLLSIAGFIISAVSLSRKENSSGSETDFQ